MIRRFTLTSSGLTTVTTAYTSGDVLGAEMTLTLKDRGGGGIGGSIVGAVVTDDSDVIGALDLFFFEAASTPAADNAANSWSDANWLNLCGVLSIATTVIDSANNKAMVTSNSEQSMPFYAPNGSLYVVAVTRTGNAVFASGASALTYKLFVDVC